MSYSFYEYLAAGVDDTPEKSATFCGEDSHGPYEARAFIYSEHNNLNILETRRYFYENCRLKRVAQIWNEELIRTEECSEDRSRQYITSYGGANEWLWERSIDHKIGHGKLSVNRDSFIFFNVLEDMIRSLEAGEFQPEQLLEIRWEDTREAILEILGAARVVPGLPMQAIDRFGPNRLLKMEWQDMWGSPRMEPWCFLELHCTSTGKISYLRVPPGFSDIMSAIAWTFGMDKEKYRLEEET